MPTVHNPYPLNQLQRISRSVSVIETQAKKTPETAEEITTFCDYKNHGWKIISAKNCIHPLVRINCEDGSSFDVCPWCQRFHSSDKLNETFLFSHKIGCTRPSYQYTVAECGQLDYDDGWS